MIKPGPHPKPFLENKNLLGREVEDLVNLMSIASVNMSSCLTYLRIARQNTLKLICHSTYRDEKA